MYIVLFFLLQQSGQRANGDSDWEKQAQQALQAALANFDRLSGDTSGCRTPDSLRTDCTLPELDDDNHRAQKNNARPPQKRKPPPKTPENQKSSACVIL